MFKKLGPGVLVAAAFIGPGTVTACTLAGVDFGFNLLWAMLLSIIATFILQEMSARLGIVTQKGLADVIKQELHNPIIRNSVIALIFSAIIIGNASYEAGNIGGATLGMEALFGTNYSSLYPFVLGGLAFVLLYLGSYKALEKVFIVLVLIMSLSFVMTAILTKPNMWELLKGILVPSVPKNGILTIIALVGTTVVPYNLFLHAALVSEKWKSKDDLNLAKRDTMVSIILGGLVSISIIISAAAINSLEVNNVMGMAKALEPLYGSAALYFLGIGMFAAGITSSITAPLAAAYVANSCFGWNVGLKDFKFRMIWMVILFLGVFFLSFGIKPIEIIKFAQITNGLLLPIIAVFLLWVVNRVGVMGKYKNTWSQNVFGLLIILLSVVLGAKSILTVIGIM
ncbi:NRAMP (natural resistance-associated macrophage protein) metal ion transporters [Maribacter dokdonensis]|uniref:NRAMP (Natural resistance-associated macrophage protein) metal ion transporters n=1 Tax=Maribacter dokdonensis TaxID=320912 RepID=A0A1H4R1G6_9FLAO|nr:Nramp family divalent metal transporter [Maribacter dokdonensis]SDS64590.1 NRAMP (natural resistance-associated macrophage protein) metal ion transporters [Maribacter dokdonensis]SEC25759.1 NRAMP (natural resistance-associated macrophage protein) metal ion transporters [Maribacter dokdonensis]